MSGEVEILESVEEVNKESVEAKEVEENTEDAVSVEENTEDVVSVEVNLEDEVITEKDVAKPEDKLKPCQYGKKKRRNQNQRPQNKFTSQSQKIREHRKNSIRCMEPKYEN